VWFPAPSPAGEPKAARSKCERVEFRLMARGAVLLSLAVGAAARPQPLVLDDAGASIRGGSHCAGGGYNNGFHHNGVGVGQDFAVWNFTVRTSGCYLVEEYHPPSSCSGHALGRVPLRIDFSRGQAAWTSVNQSSRGGRWNSLGFLPFDANWPSRIAFSSSELSDYACPQQGCFWVADAFRLSYLTPSCHEVEALLQRPSARDGSRAGVDGQASPVTSPVPAASGEQSLVVQASLLEPKTQGEKAAFTFRPPLDGCYMIQERHPHVPGAASVTLEVIHDRGFVAHGTIDHTDGHHLRWNYLASLPFSADRDGSIVLPRASLEQAREHPGRHEFMLTRVGPTCDAPESQVHRVVLRITADFGFVRDRLAAFRTDLESLLARAAGIEPSRLSVSQLREGSIVAEVTLLPAAALRVNAGRYDAADSAASAARALVGSAGSWSFARDVCNLANARAFGCGVFVAAVGRAPYVGAALLAVSPRPSGAPGADGEGGVEGPLGLSSPLLIVLGCLAGVVLLLVGGCCALAWTRRARSRAWAPPTKQKQAPAKALTEVGRAEQQGGTEGTEGPTPV